MTIVGFSDDEGSALASVLDEIIPASHDGKLPGAGELGLVGYIEGAIQKTPELKLLILQGLSTLDELAATKSARSFRALPKAQKVEVLNQFSANDAAFIPSLMFHTYVGYYQSERVVDALGIEPRPPHPKGYEMEPNDLSLLDPVRNRSKLYRE